MQDYSEMQRCAREDTEGSSKIKFHIRKGPHLDKILSQTKLPSVFTVCD